MVGELGVVQAGAHAAVGGEEFGLGGKRDGVPAAAFCPRLQVGEVDVGGEVLAAEAVVDLGALETLVVEVGAQGAAGAAAVEGGHGVAVVDGEQARLAHGAGPGGEPLGGGDMHLDAIADGRLGGEGAAGREFARHGAFLHAAVLDAHADLGPAVGGAFEEPAGERVDEFVGKDEGAPVAGGESVGHGVVPPHAHDGGHEAPGGEGAALLLAEHGGGFHDVVGEPEATQGAEAAQGGAGEFAGAGAGLDDVPAG